MDPAGPITRRSGGNADSVFDNLVERASREIPWCPVTGAAVEMFELSSNVLTKLASARPPSGAKRVVVFGSVILHAFVIRGF